MQDADLFLELAAIAGVFVGFGALITVRTGEAGGAFEVTYIRSVVTLGVWSVIVAMAPVILSRYGVTAHELWLVCSLLGLALFLGLWIVNERTTESRTIGTAYSRAQLAGMVASNLAFTIPMIAMLVLVVLGPFPGQEPALYLTAVGLGLSLAAFSLLSLVLSQRRPRTAPRSAEPPTMGASSV